MEVISSFTIDHTKLKPGIYISREDKGFTTFDIRFTEPNKEPAITPAAMHSIEHLMATWFRNSEVKEDVVYVGPWDASRECISSCEMGTMWRKCACLRLRVLNGFLNRRKYLPRHQKRAETICFTTCLPVNGSVSDIKKGLKPISIASTLNCK